MATLRAGRAGRAAAVAGVALLLWGCAAAPPAVMPTRPIAVETPGERGGTVVQPPATEPPDPERPEPSEEVHPTTPAPPTGAADDEVTPEQAVEFVAALNETLDSGVLEHWDALVQLDGSERQQQRDWFEGVLAVPMEVRELHVTGVHRQWDDSAGTTTVNIAFEHQITGADPVPAVQRYRYTIGRDDDGAVGLQEVTEGSTWFSVSPQLWDVGPVQVWEDDAVVVLGHPDRADDAEYLLDALNVAAEEVLEEMGHGVAERFAVTMAEEDQVTELFGGTGLTDLAGLAVAVPGVEQVTTGRDGMAEVDTAELSPVRLVLLWEYTLDEWRFYGPGVGGGSPLMRHEAVHGAQWLRHPDALPAAWVSEGLAGWMEFTGDPWALDDLYNWYAMTTDGEPPTELPPQWAMAFHSDEPNETERHYAESAMVFVYVEERWGRQITLELGDSLHAVGVRDDQIDPVLQEHLGQGYDEFVEGFLAWVAPYAESY